MYIELCNYEGRQSIVRRRSYIDATDLRLAPRVRSPSHTLPTPNAPTTADVIPRRLSYSLYHFRSAQEHLQNEKGQRKRYTACV